MVCLIGTCTLGYKITHQHSCDFNVKPVPPQIFDLDLKNIIVCASFVCFSTFITQILQLHVVCIL